MIAELSSNVKRVPIPRIFRILSGGVFLVIIFCSSCREGDAYREKIRVLGTELSTRPHTKEDVRALVHQSRFRGLTLREDSPVEWGVEAPIETGAKNWVLYIEFKDSKVAALRVRTADSKNEHPKSAPPDQVFP